MQRRLFIKSIGTASLGVLSVPVRADISSLFPQGELLSFNTLHTLSTEDDRFWAVVRSQFPLTYDRAYFNTGGIGASPYSVINAVKSKMDELEEMGEVGRSDTIWTGIKTKAAQIFGCSPSEIALTGCCTESMNMRQTEYL
jgi:hypothetical protein